MAVSMYQISVPVFARMLTNLIAIMEKAVAHCEEKKIDPGVLINNALLEVLARENPAAAAQLEGVAGPKHWQRRELGAELLACLRTAA